MCYHAISVLPGQPAAADVSVSWRQNANLLVYVRSTIPSVFSLRSGLLPFAFRKSEEGDRHSRDRPGCRPDEHAFFSFGRSLWQRAPPKLSLNYVPDIIPRNISNACFATNIFQPHCTDVVASHPRIDRCPRARRSTMCCVILQFNGLTRNSMMMMSTRRPGTTITH